MNFLEFLKNQVLVIDGAMGTMVQNLELSDADYGGPDFKMLPDILVFSRPDDIKNIHLEYYKAGAHAVETNTFGASQLRLSEYDFSKLNLNAFQGLPEVNLTELTHTEMSYHMSVRAAQLAQKAAQEYKTLPEYDGRPLFVLGSIGPSNWVLTNTKANLNKGDYNQILTNFYHQCLGLIDGGADVFLFETQQDPLELKAAVHGAQKAMQERNVKVPIVTQVTVDQFCKMQIFNTDILSVLTTLQGIGVDVFGINCSIGPDLMEKTVKKLSQYSQIPISVIPNAGLPVSEDGKTVFKLTPQELAEYTVKFVKDYGVNMVGGCCGTTPAHIQAVSQAVKNLKPKQRQIENKVFVSGPQNAIELDGSQSLIRIGERLNVRGSKKVREAVEVSDPINFDALEEVVEEQVRDLGVGVIDVCMDSNLVNTEDTLVKVIRHITTDFAAAMCLDSFSVEALVEAIQVYPGRPIINSISLEEYKDGVDKIDAVVSQTHQHNPIYVALCTDQTGPAQTAEQKVDLARRIYEKCRDKYGVKAGQLMIDMNAFPIGSESEEGMNFALESLKAIEGIKAIHPDIMISLGVGNLTNGLAKKPYMRKVLTSVFMQDAREKGMDAAIINPHHYVPVESLDQKHVTLANRIIFDRDMDAFSELEDIAETKKSGTVKKKCNYESLNLEDAICQKIKDGYKNKCPGSCGLDDFNYDYQDTIVPQVAEALKTHKPLEFINNYLMKAMKELGDGFGRGEVSLPHLLKSADVMKSAMGFIEGYMKHTTGGDVHDQIQYKGTVVLGTVYQDVHSIGKDLVKTLLENYGYRVIDLGVQVPLDKFIDTAIEEKADAIGLSALLVQTSNHMITVAQKIQEKGLNCDLLIGGAPVNSRHAAYVSMYGQDDMSSQMNNVFYCSSGMDGVNVMNQLKESDQKRESLLSENFEKLKWHYEQAKKSSAEESKLLKNLPRREIKPHIWQNIDFFSERVIQQSLSEFKSHLDLKTLFSLNWKYGGKASWLKKGVSEDSLTKQLEDWIETCDQNKWLAPQAVCALIPCQAKGDTLYLFEPSKMDKPIAEFDFSVVIGRDKKDKFSAAQYFAPLGSDSFDVIGFQISSGGPDVDKQIEVFKQEGDSESALLLQGLSDRVAEDMADYCHQMLREIMGVSQKQGTRYSPGYPGLKELKVNKLINEFVNGSKNLGIRLTSAYEFYPTGTTGAVVCFHPEASYD